MILKTYLLLLVILFSNYGFAQQLRFITVDEPPASFFDNNRNLTGFAVEYVEQLQQISGLYAQIEVLPEGRALKTGLEKPNVVMFAFSRTSEREQQFHWLSLIIRKQWVLYGKSDSKLQLNNLHSLRSLDAIGVVRGDVRAKWLESLGMTNLSYARDHTRNVMMFKQNRVPVIFFESLGMKHIAEQIALPEDDYLPLFIPFTSDVYIAISKSSSEQLVSKLFQATNEFKQLGGAESLAKKWSVKLQDSFDIGAQAKDGELYY